MEEEDAVEEVVIAAPRHRRLRDVEEVVVPKSSSWRSRRRGRSGSSRALSVVEGVKAEPRRHRLRGWCELGGNTSSSVLLGVELEVPISGKNGTREDNQHTWMRPARDTVGDCGNHQGTPKGRCRVL